MPTATASGVRRVCKAPGPPLGAAKLATPLSVTLETQIAQSEPLQRLHFGGPGAPDGALRDRLAKRVRASERDDRIDFVTYYFRDRRLAADLAAAAARGVDVHVSLEARPRHANANDNVIELLERPIGEGGIGDGLHLIDHRSLIPTTKLRARLHEKLYVFSNPPAAFVGSFNPSGDEPEIAPVVVQEIGDHDRGYNLLVELRDPALLRKLAAHARSIHRRRHSFFERFLSGSDATVGDCEIFFLPRVSTHPFFAKLSELGRGDRARIVASHVSGKATSAALGAAAARGARIELLSHESLRRFPAATEAALVEHAVLVERIGSETAHPMHDKFALLDVGGTQLASFGSYNLNSQSRWLNHEIGVFSSNANICAALEERWEQLRAAAQ